jgi:hypothetical protein
MVMVKGDEHDIVNAPKCHTLQQDHEDIGANHDLQTSEGENIVRFNGFKHLWMSIIV